jgi:hypothetical protein
VFIIFAQIIFIKKGNKMKYTRFLIAVMIMVSIFACQNSKEESATKDATTVTQGHKTTVEEAINGKTYTYLRLSENDTEYWIAISLRDTKVGETIYYDDAIEMENFESKELNRTFDVIRFVSKVGNEPIASNSAMDASGVMGKKPELSKADLAVKKAEGGITIAELYANKEAYNGKTVVIRGKITKLNKEIMKRNWLHIQDGTSNDNEFDLTVTTNEVFNVGDVVTLRGTIALSKDFGAGYFYDVIMESASVVSSDAI